MTHPFQSDNRPPLTSCAPDSADTDDVSGALAGGAADAHPARPLQTTGGNPPPALGARTHGTNRYPPEIPDLTYAVRGLTLIAAAIAAALWWLL